MIFKRYLQFSRLVYNHYDTLGLNFDATPQQIKLAFYKV